MNHIIIALPNDPELAAWIGKKGSENGITFYDRTADGTSIVVLTPTNLQDKFYAMAEILTLANVVLISTKSVNSIFGEALIGASLLGKKAIFSDENNVDQIISNAGLANFEYTDRATLFEKMKSASAYAVASLKDKELLINIDKSFPVKGVGTVLLGIVEQGTVRVHDKLYLGNGKELLIRSIQVQDQDVESAEPGARVGLAIKGAEDKEVGKGDILARKPIGYQKSFNAEITQSSITKNQPLEGQYTLVSNFSVTVCKVSKEGDGFRVETEKEICMRKGARFLLIRSSAPRIFASGMIK